MRQGVILYGPPASGKDTITGSLTALDNRYVPFPRLKAGGGRTTGYRMTTPEAIDALRASHGIIWENSRYSARYVIDKPELATRLDTHVPVLHLGQVDGVRAVVDAFPDAAWTVVYLWCPRDVAAERIRHRQTGDTDARLIAYDQTAPLPTADVTINTAETSPAVAAREIHRHVARLSITGWRG